MACAFGELFHQQVPHGPALDAVPVDDLLDAARPSDAQRERGGPYRRETAALRGTLTRAGRPVAHATLTVTPSDRSSVHGLARACARGDAHAPWTWTWTTTIRYHGRG